MEAQLLRNVHESLFDTPLTVQLVCESTVPSLDSTKSQHAPPFDELLLSTFHLGPRIRALAADLTLGIRSYSRRKMNMLAQEEASFLEDFDQKILHEIYAESILILEDAPTRIKTPNNMRPADEDVGAY
ncbi:hypothetical protein BJX70DRAFT_398910 [Aspergillus crustosus]